MPDRSSLEILSSLLTLRITVGFLGQKQFGGWWNCAFLDATGLRFLQTTFPRSAPSAAVHSLTEAACRVHDDALGKIGLFHLFRFPISIEDRLEELLPTVVGSSIYEAGPSQEAAMSVLRELADALITAPPGPVQVGVERQIVTRNSINELAAHYLSAFQQGIRCFPYFGPDRANA